MLEILLACILCVLCILFTSKKKKKLKSYRIRWDWHGDNLLGTIKGFPTFEFEKKGADIVLVYKESFVRNIWEGECFDNFEDAKQKAQEGINQYFWLFSEEADKNG